RGLPKPHPRPNPRGLGCRGDRADQRLGTRLRRERGRLEREARPLTKRRTQLEPGDGEAGDHGNVCSTRTHVPLSTPPAASYARPMPVEHRVAGHLGVAADDYDRTIRTFIPGYDPMAPTLLPPLDA